jgi:hypothetical protein
MFVCAYGDHVTEPRVPQVRVVTEMREREYTNDEGMAIAVGWEIVSEENLCPEHAAELREKEGASG